MSALAARDDVLRGHVAGPGPRRALPDAVVAAADFPRLARRLTAACSARRRRRSPRTRSTATGAWSASRTRTRRASSARRARSSLSTSAMPSRSSCSRTASFTSRTGGGGRVGARARAAAPGRLHPRYRNDLPAAARRHRRAAHACHGRGSQTARRGAQPADRASGRRRRHGRVSSGSPSSRSSRAASSATATRRALQAVAALLPALPDGRGRLGDQHGSAPVFDSAPASFGLYGNDGSMGPRPLPCRQPLRRPCRRRRAQRADGGVRQLSGLCSAAFLWPFDVSGGGEFRLDLWLPVDDFRGPGDFADLSAPAGRRLRGRRTSTSGTASSTAPGMQATLPPVVEHLWASTAPAGPTC